MRVGREPGWPELKVGLVAVTAIVFLVLLVLKVERSQGLFSQGEIVQARLQDMRGLRMGSPVQYAGVEVGSIKKFHFEKDGSVVIAMQIQSSVRPLIKSSSRLSIESMGVLGDKVVTIKPGRADDPPLAAHEFIPTALAGGSSFDMVNDTSQAIAQARLAAEQLNQIMEKLLDAKGTAGKLIDDPSLFDDLKSLVAGLNGLMGKQGTLSKLSSDPKLYDAMSRATNNLDVTLQSINSQKGSMGKLVHDPKLYDNIDKLAQEATLLIKDIRENPKKYFKVSVF